MRERNVKSEHYQSRSVGLQESLQAIHDFVDAFPAKHLEEHAWELLSAAFNSELADTWSVKERGTMLHLYKLLSSLGYALTIIDNELHKPSS